MINVGIIGLGDNGVMHSRGFHRLEETRVAAICDTSSRARKRMLEVLGDDSIVSTNSWEKMCEMDELDAICVSVPTFMHPPIAHLALANGKDVFLEKPIAPSIRETDELIEHAMSTDRVVQVGLVYRYCNLYRTMGKMVEQGDFGDVMMAYCKEYRDNFPTQWFFETEKSGGAILDKNCHHFDLFSWFIGSRPEKIYAMGGQHVVKGKKVRINCSYAPDPDLVLRNPDIVDHAYVLVRYENGELGNLGLCMYQVEPKEGLEIGIIGTNGAHALAKKDITLTAGGGPLGEISEVPVDYHNDNHGIGHIGADRQHVEFVECIRNRTLPYANLLLARESMVISMAAEISIKENREVFAEEFDRPEITKLIEKHRKELYRDTPDPLPPPREKKEKQPSREKEIVNTFIDLVRLLMGKRPRGEAKPFDRETFARVLEKVNGNKKYRGMARGLDAVIAFKHPDAAPVYVSLKDGEAEMISGGRSMEETVVFFTEDGWKNIQTGDSVQKLLFTRQIRVEGKIDHLKPYTDAMIELANTIRG